MTALPAIDVAERVPTRCDIVRPHELGVGEQETWRTIIAQSPMMQRAFFSPAFSLACERAACRVYVGVLSDAQGICGFMPFQFSDGWHERLRLAERVGGNLSQGACFVAWPGVRLTSKSLMRFCKLSAMHVTQLIEGQEQFGLDAVWSQLCYTTSLRSGVDAYFAELLVRNRGFARETQRKIRRAEKLYGPLALRNHGPAPVGALTDFVKAKRSQYQRTGAVDPFARPETLRIIEELNDVQMAESRVVLTQLDAGQRTLARHLGLLHSGSLSWWFPVYDPDLENISAGRLLLWHIIQQAAVLGIDDIEYGEGEAQYKRQFSTGTLRMGRALWSAVNARSLLAHAWQSVEWRLQAHYKPKAEPN